MNKKRHIAFVFFIWLTQVFLVRAQDPQLSQMYAAPLLISPAFAGIDNQSNIHFTHRNQWPSLNANYQFSAISANIALGNQKSGLGVLISSDKQFLNLQTTQLGVQYGHHIDLGEDIRLSAGIQTDLYMRSLDASQFVFADQFRSINYGFISSSNDVFFQDNVANTSIKRSRYVDLSSGALLNLRNSWIGITAHHINRPDKSIFNGTNDPLNTKFGIQMGTKIIFEDPYLNRTTSNPWANKEVSISPVVHYKRQGKFDQLDMGAYLTISPLVAGLWYRGVPISNNYQHRESLIFLLGYQLESFSVGYSYDMTISKLGASAGGAHELSIAYVLNLDLSRSKRTKLLNSKLACPKF
jgi:type IX secretion system PorP/SprF family membrane protein